MGTFSSTFTSLMSTMHPTFKHILIADDDLDDLHLCREVVSEVCPKLAVSTAENGLDILKHLENGLKPQLIVLDINMPSLTGIECLQLLQQRKDYNSLTIVMLTTSNHKNDIDTCKSLGATHYYVKPWSVEGYKSIIEDFMEGCVRPNPFRKFANSRATS